MKVLITGAGGFIGQHLMEQLILDESNEIVAISKRALDYNNRVKSYICDVLNEEALQKIFREHLFQVVIHLAALTAHNQIINNRFETLEINLKGTEIILKCFNRYCRNALFLYTSTGKVYGKTNEMPITEQAYTNPTTVLGKSKLITERLIDFYAVESTNKYLVARIFNIYGGNQKDNFVVPTILNQLKSGYTLQLGNLFDKRDYLYIDDFVKAIEKLINVHEKLQHFDIVNVGSGVASSVEDIVNILKQILHQQIEVSVAQEKLRGDETPIEYCDNSKLKALTDWQAKYDLYDGLMEVCIEKGLRR